MTQNKRRPSLATFIFAFPFFFLIGLLTLLRAVFGLSRLARRARYELIDNLHCPNCHCPNPVAGRWECSSCKSIYMGWVGKCTICGADASWISCLKCGVSIVLPWTRL